MLSIEERRARGREVRKTVPRQAHSTWKPAADRRSPVDILELQSASRLPDLVPVRYQRMLASPFAFFRGGAAIMAMDLATVPRTPLHTQLCGDAHLVNFGVYGSPEREMLFDINDFDETLPGPFEWDLKRLLSSFVLAGRSNGFKRSESRATAAAAAAAYREAMQRLASMGTLAVWYSHVTVEDVIGALGAGRPRHDAVEWMQQTRSNTSIKALNRLTHLVNGRREIVDDPPLLDRIPLDSTEHADFVARFRTGFHQYRSSLSLERRHLLDHFRVIDLARKVVGVGSVGTRSYIVLLEGSSIDDPLFLQVKEAQPSVMEAYLGKGGFDNHGERVVVGQRWMQAASDIFLGWQRGDPDRDFYVRQLQDLKGSVPVESVAPAGLMLYARVCGSTLARAHARSGDSVQMAAYIGSGPSLDAALVEFAEAYADQCESDYKEFAAACKSGRLPTPSR
ncbi:MAG TPA: DUF2252 domain-containing protein [Chloroflexota bacterium]|jgi:uncharacterized protein (DUF2252 family)